MKNQKSVKTKLDNININAKNEDTDISETTANNSPIKLSVNGKLKLKRSKNNKIVLDWKSRKNNESMFLEYVRAITEPTKRKRATLLSPWAKDVIIAVSIPELLSVINAQNVKLRCVIEEKAIIFFKSTANLKNEHIIIKIIIKVKVNNPLFIIEKNKSNVI